MTTKRSTKTVHVRFGPTPDDDFGIDKHEGVDGWHVEETGALVIREGDEMRAIYARGKWFGAWVTEKHVTLTITLTLDAELVPDRHAAERIASEGALAALIKSGGGQ